MTSFSAITLPSVRSGGYADAEEQARGRGYAAGYAQGARAAERELAERRAALEAEFAAASNEARDTRARQGAAVETMLAALERRLTPVVASAQESLAAAAIDLAEAVLGAELRDDESSARSVVARVTSSVDAMATTSVRVNPGELPLLAELLGADSSIALVGDPSLARGDAIAELPNGFLDARIGSALGRARAALLEEGR